VYIASAVGSIRLPRPLPNFRRRHLNLPPTFRLRRLNRRRRLRPHHRRPSAMAPKSSRRA